MSDESRYPTLDELDGDQRQLAELIGLKNYMQLVAAFGGSTIYIRKLDSLLQRERNRDIINAFDGWNFRELGLKFNLSERTIREIVAEHMQAVRNKPIDNQLTFDELR